VSDDNMTSILFLMSKSVPKVPNMINYTFSTQLQLSNGKWLRCSKKQGLMPVAFHYTAMIRVTHIVFMKELVKNRGLQRPSLKQFNFENHGYRDKEPVLLIFWEPRKVMDLRTCSWYRPKHSFYIMLWWWHKGSLGVIHCLV
jgi:hypothetical protein